MLGYSRRQYLFEVGAKCPVAARCHVPGGEHPARRGRSVQGTLARSSLYANVRAGLRRDLASDRRLGPATSCQLRSCGASRDVLLLTPSDPVQWSSSTALPTHPLRRSTPSSCMWPFVSAAPAWTPASARASSTSGVRPESAVGSGSSTGTTMRGADRWAA